MGKPAQGETGKAPSGFIGSRSHAFAIDLLEHLR